jgi:hypothetical protein
VIIQDLPLHDLFDQLRKSGLPLGVGEYELLLKSLMAGFGIADQNALARLCKTLWVKSLEEAQIFDYHFAEVMKQAIASETAVSSQTSSAKTEPQTTPETPKFPASNPASAPDSEPTQLLPTPASNPEPAPIPSLSEPTEPALPPVLEIEDEIQVAKSAFLSASSSDEIADAGFLLTSDYLPVTKRQMKQAWRYLRRPVREGPCTELDVEATANQIARHGILLEPVLVPRRINRSELVLLIDEDGSMVPFHSLAERLMETALRGGRFGKTGIYYFHNCPVDYLYCDPGHQEAETFEQVLSRLSPTRSSVLIFSDGGAARGSDNGDRLELTEAFLNRFKQRVRYMAWLNPVPKSRWPATTAGKIGRSIPMFECDRPGLQEAIGVLRGRRTNFAGGVK